MALPCRQLFVIFPPSPGILEWVIQKISFIYHIIAPLKAHIYRIYKLEGRIRINSVSLVKKFVPR